MEKNLSRRNILGILPLAALSSSCTVMSDNEKSRTSKSKTNARKDKKQESFYQEKDILDEIKRLEELENINFVTFLESQSYILSRNPALAEVLRKTLKPGSQAYEYLSKVRKLELEEFKKVELNRDIKAYILSLNFDKALHEIGPCLGHFVGTYKILKEMGYQENEAYTGLFHAVYGTEFNPIQLLSSDIPFHRKSLSHIVGVSEEGWIYNYARMDTTSLINMVKENPGKSQYEVLDAIDKKNKIILSQWEARLQLDALVANAFEPFLASKKLGLDKKSLQGSLKRVLRFEPLKTFVSPKAKDIISMSSEKIKSL